MISTALALASCGGIDIEAQDKRTSPPVDRSEDAIADTSPGTPYVYPTDTTDDLPPVPTNIEIPETWPDELDDTCYQADAFTCLIEYTIMQETNSHRPSNDQMQHKYQISYTAREWSEIQKIARYISHDGFPEERVLIMVYEFATTGTVKMWAENVALSWSDSTDPIEIGKMITNLWWDSPVHKQNMLGNYTVLGVGVVKDGNNYWATQIFGVN